LTRILLDTHCLLWWLADNSTLGEQSRRLIADVRNEIFVSAVSIWEISIKRALGKLRAPARIDTIVLEEGFRELAVSLFHAEQAGNLPNLHRDPFDRMLIAQAQAEGLLIVSADPVLATYGVRVMDARL
jgi:PIN domain nuclease of toxin-antitoxin system